MLEFLRGKVSERRCRLFACACCRRIWGWMADERSRQAVEVCEDYADGRAGKKKLAAAAKALDASWPSSLDASSLAAAVVVNACAGSLSQVAEWTPAYASGLLGRERGDYAERTERIVQCDLLRDIFGNPFRPAPTIGPAVLDWNRRVVVRLAQRAYDDRHCPDGTLDLARLAVLADALEEAGVTDTLLLEHLRGPGPHVRGCFALDAILGQT
jgi:hypothetical protein